MTHAFFKALLFLGAGSVIHGIGGIQDIEKMGGLRKKMPWTFWTFLMGTLAIAGIPGLAGFFSKDAILGAAWAGEHYGKILWVVAAIAAGFTSFYMFRLLILVFFGNPRYTHDDVHHVHESPASMLFPLVILAILSIVGGYVGVPKVLGGSDLITTYLNGGAEIARVGEEASHAPEMLLMAAATGIALIGFAIAYLFYVAKPELPRKLAASAHAMYSLLMNKYYIDDIYDAVIVWPIVRTAREFLWKFVDVIIIDGIVNGTGRVVRVAGSGLRHMQTGYVRTYAAWILFGGILVVAWFLR